MFISLGGSQLFTGIMMNRFSEKFCRFKLTVIGTLIIESAGIASLICYFTKSFPLCFICAFLWGCSENFAQTVVNALVGFLFPGKIEAYIVFKIFFATGVCSILLINIALSSVDDYIFLSIILTIQIIMTGVTINLKDLDEP